ncbi:hypothetical protein SAMN05216480_12323 [Pustulibacterium marinum]|uniref:Uncharacterized protein n=1 Tax=Pustulibacterium marinum TaxID=1224947 RepID=A0A1I7IW72_9FLAO|nr:hypothetical protein [Pustulibacterium marinum]SFU77149.1 hypothetical protein SAMN05216480_12323 [Pustulibacterium marinum]
MAQGDLTVQVKAATVFGLDAKKTAIKFIAEELTDEEVDKLYKLAKSTTARKKLDKSWKTIKTLTGIKE